METQKAISYELNKTRVGQVFKGMVIAADPKNNKYLLRSDYNAPDDIDGQVRFNSSMPLEEGDIVEIKITQAYVYDLAGEFIRKIED